MLQNYQKKDVKQLGIVIVTICLVILIGSAIFFAYTYYQTTVAKEVKFDQDIAANWIAYSNFLLTLIALLATATGIVFALYEYYRLKELDKRVEKVMNENLKKWENATNQKLKNMTKAYSLLIEQAITEDANKVKESRMDSFSQAEDAYPDLWGLKYFKALSLYFDSDKNKDKEGAIQLMKEHLKDNQDHTKAHVFLLFWCLREEDKLSEAMHALKGLLEQKPDYCYQRQIIEDETWEESPSILKEKNRILYQAEQIVYRKKKQLDEFLKPDAETKLEKLLRSIYRDHDPSVYDRKILLHLTETGKD